LPFPNAISHPSISMSSSPSAEIAALSVDPCSDVDASAIELFEVGGAKDCRKSRDTGGRQYNLCHTKVARETEDRFDWSNSGTGTGHVNDVMRCYNL
jgi:hypothetical protein